MEGKIGCVFGKLYPNVFSAIINRKLARCRKLGLVYDDPLKYFEYAKLVEQRYNRRYQNEIHN